MLVIKVETWVQVLVQTRVIVLKNVWIGISTIGTKLTLNGLLRRGSIIIIIIIIIIILFAQGYDDKEFMIRKLLEEYEKWGLKINLQTTFYTGCRAKTKDI